VLDKVTNVLADLNCSITLYYRAHAHPIKPAALELHCWLHDGEQGACSHMLSKETQAGAKHHGLELNKRNRKYKF